MTRGLGMYLYFCNSCRGRFSLPSEMSMCSQCQKLNPELGVVSFACSSFRRKSRIHTTGGRSETDSPSPVSCRPVWVKVSFQENLSAFQQVTIGIPETFGSGMTVRLRYHPSRVKQRSRQPKCSSHHQKSALCTAMSPLYSLRQAFFQRNLDQNPTDPSPQSVALSGPSGLGRF